MQAQAFIAKWGPGGSAHELNERQGAQAHFIDLCRLLGVPEPGDPERYCSERDVKQTGGAGLRTDGWADVWLRGHFAWEYKAPGLAGPGPRRARRRRGRRLRLDRLDARDARRADPERIA